MQCGVMSHNVAHCAVQDKDGTPHSAYMYQALGMCSHPYVDDYSWSEYKTPRNTGLFGQIYRLHEPLEHDNMKIIGVFEDKHKRGLCRMVLLMDLALELYQTSSDAKYIMNNSGKQERWCWYVYTKQWGENGYVGKQKVVYTKQWGANGYVGK